MIGLHWTQADLDGVSPARRERLLWALHAERLSAARDRIAERTAYDQMGVTRIQAALAALDLALFPRGT